MFDLGLERAALQEAVTTCELGGYVSRRQIGGINGLMKQGLTDATRENKIAVLRYLIGDAIYERLGVEFESTKNMTSGIASILINLWLAPGSKWTLNNYGHQLIAAAEAAVKTQAYA